MQAEIILNISIEELWAMLEQSLLQDINQRTNKKIEASKLKSGLKFTLTRNDKHKTTLEYQLKEYNYQSDYYMKIKAGNGINHIRVKLENVENQTKLSYEETFNPGPSIDQNGLYFKISNFFYQRKLKKRVNQIVSNMPKYLENYKKQKEADQAK